MAKKATVISHNLKGYDSHLIMNKIVYLIPSGLEKYMTFIINKDLVFIGSKQFMNSSLEKLVNNLSDNYFKNLTQEFGSENLKI